IPGGEVFTGLRRVGRAKLLRVELLGHLVRLDQPGPASAVALHARPATLVGDRVADPVGETLHGLDERQVLDPHHERDDVAALPAAEDGNRPLTGPYVDAGLLPVVERPPPLHRAHASAPQRDILADPLVDPAQLAPPRDVGIPDSPRHGWGV